MNSERQFWPKLKQWYLREKRSLPWRETRDPYQIWVSEVILQQTRVDQGLPYYHRFLKAFPNVKKLAAASETAVLKLWEGLGYYSRARNMHAAAQYVSKELKGQFPNNFKDLQQLKGIGPYTAAAIASFAFDEPVAVCDGNVMRVLSRLYASDADISKPAGQKVLSNLAQELIPEKEAALFNQAIMEFGALHCVPKQPDCLNCPLKSLCKGFALDIQHELPIKTGKVSKTNRYLNYFILINDGGYWIKERVGKGIWQGLYEFPVLELDKAATEQELETNANVNFGLTKGPDFLSTQVKHLLSHQNLFIRFYISAEKIKIKFRKKLISEGYIFYEAKLAKDFPYPVVLQRFLKETVKAYL